jgi:GTP-binding protein Era
MQARMRKMALATLPDMDVILHLHPAPDAPAPPFEQLAALERPPSAPVLRVYTKGDLVSAMRRQELEADAVVVSAEQGKGLDRLLDRIRPLLPERDFEHDPDDVSTQQLRFFVVEYLREAAFEVLEDELPYAFHAEVDEFREDRSPVYIRATLFVERESQKRIVIGHGGTTIKTIGSSARARIEELIGAPVYLDLWAKALPGWRKNTAALTRFGFSDPGAGGG